MAYSKEMMGKVKEIEAACNHALDVINKQKFPAWLSAGLVDSLYRSMLVQISVQKDLFVYNEEDPIKHAQDVYSKYLEQKGGH